MGWIWRRVSTLDKRSFDIGLTEAGLHTVWKVTRVLFRQRPMRKAYEAPLSPDPFSWPPPPKSKRYVLECLHDHYQMLRLFARTFGDTSFLRYDLGGPYPNPA